MSICRVKFICNVGAGYDTIDVVTSAKLGIYLSNTPGAVDAVSTVFDGCVKS